MKKIISAALLTLAVGGAHAQVYLGGALGLTSIDLDCVGTISCDNNDSGVKVYGGYSFTPEVAIEVGYLDFGKASAQLYTSLGLTNLEIKSTAIVVAAALHGNFTPNFGGTFRLGLASVETEVTGHFPAIGASSSLSESNAKAYFGLGLDYAFTKNLKGVVSADFTNTETNGEKAAIRLFTIGAQYNF